MAIQNTQEILQWPSLYVCAYVHYISKPLICMYVFDVPNRLPFTCIWKISFRTNDLVKVSFICLHRARAPNHDILEDNLFCFTHLC